MVKKKMEKKKYRVDQFGNIIASDRATGEARIEQIIAQIDALWTQAEEIADKHRFTFHFRWC